MQDVPRRELTNTVNYSLIRSQLKFQKVTSGMFNSSPIRSPTALEAAAEIQRDRVSLLYHPMSSPSAKREKERKQKQAEEIRERRRLLRLELNREKIIDIESYNQQLRELKEQADALEVDPDQLIETSEEYDEDNDDEYDYADQLEEYLADAELELEQQLRDLYIGDEPSKAPAKDAKSGDESSQRMNNEQKTET